MEDPLADEEDGALRYLFHTTSYAALDAIASDGLTPRQGGGTFRHGGYDIYSQGKLFAALGDAALEWFGKVGDQLEHYASDDGVDLEERAAEIVPVMLRIDLEAVMETPLEDPVGSRDVAGSYYFTDAIDPGAIEFWHPRKQAWVALEDAAVPSPMLGIASVEYYDEDGDVVDEDDWDGETPPGLESIGPYEPGGFKPPYS